MSDRPRGQACGAASVRAVVVGGGAVGLATACELGRRGWSVTVVDAGEAENVVRDACVCAYRGLKQFAGRTTFATWLTKITINQALKWLRRQGRWTEFEETMSTVSSNAPSPEQQVANRELGELLEG